MQYIELPGTDLQASVLGFGCAPIMGRVGRRTALRALEEGYRYGINYFDVARSYGYGKAEAVVGEFIQKRREKVLLATKIGLEPPSNSRSLHLILPIVRQVLSWLPSGAQNLLKSSVKKSGVTRAEQGRFDVAMARESLHTSLRELGTDYVDVLLLHLCTLADMRNPDLLRFLGDCVREGKVRYCGVATDMYSCNTIFSESTFFNIAQFENNICSPGCSLFNQGNDTAIITHSPMGQQVNLLQQIVTYAKQHPHRRKEWSAMIGQDIREEKTAAHLLLSYALQANARGPVLCSMFDTAHLMSNVKTATDPLPEDGLNTLLPHLGSALGCGAFGEEDPGQPRSL